MKSLLIKRGLSVPEYYADVERAKEVEVEWFDDSGVKCKKAFRSFVYMHST